MTCKHCGKEFRYALFGIMHEKECEPIREGSMCEWPEGCKDDAELKVGFVRPSFPLCRVHAVCVAFKLLLESPVPQPIGFDTLQFIRIE